MKLFLYGTMDALKLQAVPHDWFNHVYVTNDNKIAAIEEFIAEKQFNTNTISKLGFKDLNILQNSFLEFLKKIDKFNLTLKGIKFDREIEECVIDEIKDFFYEKQIIKAVKRLCEVIIESECEIKSITFIDNEINELIEVSNRGVVQVTNDTHLSLDEWFKKAYYLYILSDNALPEEARRFLQ
ncbi:hypothetical protein J5TS2_40320 [Brevibacillus halotolerans]|uniref:hypothetical protein n=1 Tax=Brevibacillus halotolerans TaxID=1507437 RepID=UPI001B1A9AEA|nr:hypothetical protein [Brevibacillus halotolerans]GIO03364.1 hypothetical protein J5TS2_40320 [Brevibacillus halotolerans]